MNTRAAAGPFAPPTVRHGNEMQDEGILFEVLLVLRLMMWQGISRDECPRTPPRIRLICISFLYSCIRNHLLGSSECERCSNLVLAIRLRRPKHSRGIHTLECPEVHCAPQGPYAPSSINLTLWPVYIVRLRYFIEPSRSTYTYVYI